MQSIAKVQDLMVKLVPGGEHDLSHLCNAELLTSTRRLVGTSNESFATLLLHLAEVEARGIHRERACASLYSYCVYELRMSEDAAARRSSAARLVKAFPLLLHAIAAGELHLTGPLVPTGAIDHGSTEPGDGDAPARYELPPITAPQQYKMQLSTSAEHVRLVERAKALLARTAPACSLGELHRQAMKLLVGRFEKEKFALTEPRAVRRAGERSQTAQPRRATTAAGLAKGKRENPPGAQEQRTNPPRRRGRHVPAAVKREVFRRDRGCCNYVDERGERCHETRYLELHHLQPFAHGGEHVATNLALRCVAHNGLAAEKDFGRAVIEHKRHAERHDSLRAQARPCPSTKDLQPWGERLPRDQCPEPPSLWTPRPMNR